MKNKMKTQMRKLRTREAVAKRKEQAAARLSIPMEDDYYGTTMAASHYDVAQMTAKGAWYNYD